MFFENCALAPVWATLVVALLVAALVAHRTTVKSPVFTCSAPPSSSRYRIT